MTEYVAGFCFNERRDSVALVEKLKPDWMCGSWNAIGGKIEKSDRTPWEAMRREFKEETGVTIDNWNFFVSLSGDGWICYFFRAFNDKVYDCTTVEEEVIRIFPNKELPTIKMANLGWLLAMALDIDKDRAVSFEVKEHYA